jgi:probable HAF family extracellular repeat protein
MQDIGTLGGLYNYGSYALGINSRGQVVGTSITAGGDRRADHAFLYTKDLMLDLNSLIDPAAGWVFNYANAINDAGQIVGWGVNALGQQHALLLNPPPPGTLTIVTIPMLTFYGVSGNTYSLEYANVIGATNAWNVLSTFTMTNSTQIYADISAAGQRSRFYRVVQSP